jgi:cytochrome c biogenesis protein CcmG/thiol:disulfide interchange protein DsbE
MSSPRSVLFWLTLAAALACFGIVCAQAHAAVNATSPTWSQNDGPKPAPDFSLKTLDGGHISLADFKGKVVVLNFWATYCVPCKTETPWFVDLQKNHAADGLQVIGITMDEPENKRLPKFVSDLGINYPIAFGDYDTADAYDHVEALPVTFFITRDGKIAKEIRGIENKEQLEQEATKLLAK